MGRFSWSSPSSAPPCVEPFEGDNGGATAPGVTADTIKVVEYIVDPALDPLTIATVASAGAEINPESAAETVQGFADLYNRLHETYGRRVEIETYTGTGAGDDLEAARTDAIAIAEKDPFIVIGGPAQASTVFSIELASRGIICAGICATAMPEEIAGERPYHHHPTQGCGRHDDHLLRRPADACVADQGGDGAGLPPGMDHGAHPLHGHVVVCPPDRHGAVEERYRDRSSAPGVPWRPTARFVSGIGHTGACRPTATRTC